MIVIVTGLPGSGKSYFASHLSPLIDAVCINSDRIRKKMFTERIYSEAEKLSVYKEMLAEMKASVQRHKNVVLNATFYKKRIRARQGWRYGYRNFYRGQSGRGSYKRQAEAEKD